jgi:hypothetical protein
MIPDTRIDETHLTQRLERIGPGVLNLLVKTITPLAAAMTADAKTRAAAHIHFIGLKNPDENVIPATAINDVLDELDLALRPDHQIDFNQTNPNILGAQWSLRLYSCIAGSLKIASKQDDFTIPEMAFSAFANAANNVGEINTAV